jgi:probable phosphoglycerate mutase
LKKFVGQKETNFFVLRHGETKWNSINKLHGHLDSPLTKKGVCQALQQNKSLHLQDLSNFIVISSPQKRAYDTAVVALSGITDKINIDDDLVEIGIGDWSGKKIEKHRKRFEFKLYKV